MSKALVVGITGGIGGGKSTLSAVLRNKGYYVYDTDIEAKKMQDNDPDVREQIIKLFGSDIYTSEGLDRKKIASIVFNDPQKLIQLNKIAHPSVLKNFDEWVKGHQSEKILFIESAIIFEIGLDKKLDKVVVVTAPEDVRVARVMKRDGVSEGEVRSRIVRQMPEEEKVMKADIVIDSDKEYILNSNADYLLEELQK